VSTTNNPKPMHSTHLHIMSQSQSQEEPNWKCTHCNSTFGKTDGIFTYGVPCPKCNVGSLYNINQY
jgi:hypothetical protein